MILDDFSHDGQANAAAAGGRCPGRIGAVKPIKHIGQILGSDAFSVVLNLHADRIYLIQNADINPSVFLIQIFYTVSDNVADDLSKLLRICNNLRIMFHKIGKIEGDIFEVPTKEQEIVPVIVLPKAKEVKKEVVVNDLEKEIFGINNKDIEDVEAIKKDLDSNLALQELFN